MKQYFILNERLGIEVPDLQEDWGEIPDKDQQYILLKWESIRGYIPDRIQELEQTINQKQHQLNHEADFEVSCRLNSEIANLASVINDLWLWYRIHQDISTEKTHS